MRKILFVSLGLLLIAGMSYTATTNGEGVEAPFPTQPGLGQNLGRIQILDDIHSCKCDQKQGNEVVGLIKVVADVNQVYKVDVWGLSVFIEKWQVGPTMFLSGSADIPKFQVQSNYHHLISICNVENLKGATGDVLELGFRLKEVGGNVVVPKSGASGDCILCKDINCPFGCGANLYCPKKANTGCALCNANPPHSWTTPCGHGTCDEGNHPNSTGNKIINTDNNNNGWVEVGEVGVGVTSSGFTKTYELEIMVSSDWDDDADDDLYTGGSAKIVFHPSI